MTRDDIIRMAREAGCHEASHPMNPWSVTQEALERFASLVAAAEREACAKVCDDEAKETFSRQCQVWGEHFARAIRARKD